MTEEFSKRKWIYKNEGSVHVDDYYEYYFKCNNCEFRIPIHIKKGIWVDEIDDIVCINCGVTNFREYKKRV